MAYGLQYEEFYEREDELTDKEFRLYIYIIFHTFPDKDGTRIYRKDRMSINELCRTYSLDKKNTQRYIKRLRTGQFSRSHRREKVKPMKTAWLFEDRKGNLIPIVGVKRTSQIEAILKYESVNFTPEDSDTSVNFTPPSVNFTPDECKFYTENGSNGVNFTPPLKDIQKPLNNALIPATTETVVVVEDIHLSKFSEEDCLRWAQISATRTGTVRDVHALASYAYKTGKRDLYIQATLYPEKPEEDPLSDELAEGLELLLDVKAKGEDVDEYKHWYSEEDWQWLMTQLEK